jgi:hypothetical protein
MLRTLRPTWDRGKSERRRSPSKDLSDSTLKNAMLRPNPEEDTTMPAPQTLKNHVRYDPIFHFCIMPLLVLNFIFSIYITVHNWPSYKHTHLWWIVMAVVLFMMAGYSRESALKAQNRIIRLEERLRLAMLLPPADRAHINDLTTHQLIALRFASDAELPALARVALTQRLEAKAIKQSIINWRADHERV